jgi:hypothetical protein
MDILGEEVTGKQLLKISVDAIAAHQLLQYVTHNDKEERIRIAAGLTLLGLGYIYGPHLQEKVNAMKDARLNDASTERVVYAAGGAILGSIVGRYFDRHGRDSSVTPSAPGAMPLPGADWQSRSVQSTSGRSTNGQSTSGIDARVRNVVVAATEYDTTRRPHPVIVIGSVGWLGYSLFFNGKTPEERLRHKWGIGAGAVGYAFGPQIIHKFDRILLTKPEVAQADSIYQNGGMLLGAVAGGLLGWHKAEDARQLLR